MYVSSHLMVRRDAAAAAHTIMASEFLFRAGIVMQSHRRFYIGTPDCISFV
jgi:hypothetical protein